MGIGTIGGFSGSGVGSIDGVGGVWPGVEGVIGKFGVGDGVGGVRFGVDGVRPGSVGIGGPSVG